MATIDAATNSNAALPEAELQVPAAPQTDSERTLPPSSTKPGAALAALSASPLTVVAGADAANLSGTIAAAEQRIMADPEQVLSLLGGSLTATESLFELDAAADHSNATSATDIQATGGDVRVATPAEIQQSIAETRHAIEQEQFKLEQLSELKRSAGDEVNSNAIDNEIEKAEQEISALYEKLALLFEAKAATPSIEH